MLGWREGHAYNKSEWWKFLALRHQFGAFLQHSLEIHPRAGITYISLRHKISHTRAFILNVILECIRTRRPICIPEKTHPLRSCRLYSVLHINIWNLGDFSAFSSEETRSARVSIFCSTQSCATPRLSFLEWAGLLSVCLCKLHLGRPRCRLFMCVPH